MLVYHYNYFYILHVLVRKRMFMFIVIQTLHQIVML